MKKLIFCILAIATGTSAMARDFINAKIVYKDGRQATVLVGALNSYTERNIAIKSNASAKEESVASELLQSISYYTTTDTIVYERVPLLSSINKKVGDTVWLRVIMRGYATLYFGVNEGYNIYHQNNTYTTWPADQNWYCMRNGEAGAFRVSSNFKGNMNPNNDLRMFGSKYFADAPEIVAKIKHKTYTWKTVVDMVTDYNKLKGAVK